MVVTLLERLTWIKGAMRGASIVVCKTQEESMRVWRLILGVALSVITGTAQAADGGARVDERLVYEIVVTAPGTRSQGWHGTIYDSTGKPVSIEPGQRFETAVGTFESVACPHLWSMCGMIHTDMLAWMKTHDANVIMGREPWAYRLFVLREGTKSEGFEGKIFFNGAEIARCQAPRATPMGAFVCKERTQLWDRAGWYHESWP
ncbi:MAG: hypothetical protein JNL06_01325 [Alphaproteobacteria bacterium]|nr:hypothetical protein [Alphaproteobacteria bacterium]